MSDAPTPDPTEPEVAPEPEATAPTPDAAATGATSIVAAPGGPVPVQDDPDKPSGFTHGSLVQAPDSKLWERIVHDFHDVTGEFLGWHKEPVEPPADPGPADPSA